MRYISIWKTPKAHLNEPQQGAAYNPNRSNAPYHLHTHERSMCM